jgi:hypothetical protein
MGKTKARKKKEVALIDLNLRWMMEADTKPQESVNHSKQASLPQIYSNT